MSINIEYPEKGPFATSKDVKSDSSLPPSDGDAAATGSDKRFFSEFSMSEDDKNLFELSKWLVIRCQKLKSLIIPIRDIQIYGPGKFRNRDTLEPILKKLESMNHIKLTQGKVSVNYLLIKKC